MRKISKFAAVFTAVALVVLSVGTAFAAKEKAHMRRIRLSAELVDKMAQQDDKGDLASVIKSGKGVAIFPAVTKAGLGVGGQQGNGVVLLRNRDGSWSGPSFCSIAGGSIGLQIGASKVGLVLVITNSDGIRAFTGDTALKLGANVSVAAGPAGRDASAATDGRGQAAIYSYSISKGLFAGLALDGSQLNQDRDAMKAYWGAPIKPSAALKRPAKDKRILPLVNSLNRLCKKAK